MIKVIFQNGELLIEFLVVLLLTFIAASIINKYLSKKIMQHSVNENEVTNLLFLKKIVIFIVYCVGTSWALLILPITATFAHSILAGAGMTTLIVGFASQQILGNMFNGIFIVINKPFKVGDQIEFQDVSGKVVEINWHETIVETDNKVICIIPNSMLSDNIIKNKTSGLK